MNLERARTFRLVDKGGAGLACDADGVALGGVVLAGAAGGLGIALKPASDIGENLRRAYGRQSEAAVQRCHRGLKRVAGWLEQGDLAMAGIEAVMLRLPEIDPEGMAKIAELADFEKGGDSWRDEPRVPADQSQGGEWTTGGAAPSASSAGVEGSVAGAAPSAKPAADPPIAQFRHPNQNGFYPDTGGSGGTFYIPSVSAGYHVKPTEVHADDAGSFQVAWQGGDAIQLTDEHGVVHTVMGDQKSIDEFNAGVGQTLGVHIRAYPREDAKKPPGPLDWLMEPAGYAPILPEIAAGDPSVPMGAGWTESTDPTAFDTWRPVSHLEVAGDALSVAGILAPVARWSGGSDAAVEVAAGYRATFGQSLTNDYRATFLRTYPELEGRVFVHHAVPQRTLAPP